MKTMGGFPRKSLGQRTMQHQQDVARAGARLMQLRAEQEARQQAQQHSQHNRRNAPGGGAYGSDAPTPPSRPPAPPAKASQPAQRTPRADDRDIQGQARDVRVERIPHWFFGGQSESVLTLRVEVFDEDGNQQSLCSVELRGDRMEGVVHEGDWVRVVGRRNRGIMIGQAVQVLNPDGTVVTRRAGATAANAALRGFVVIALLLISLFVAAGFLRLFRVIP